MSSRRRQQQVRRLASGAKTIRRKPGEGLVEIEKRATYEEEAIAVAGERAGGWVSVVGGACLLACLLGQGTGERRLRAGSVPGTTGRETQTRKKIMLLSSGVVSTDGRLGIR
jgi:hypothetical protein